MKKLLIASTALVATSGFAYADVTLGGSAQFGIIYVEDRMIEDDNGDMVDDDLFLQYELQFDFSASGETDSGLGFGMSAELESDSDNQGNPNDQGFDPEIFVTGEFGTVTVGSLDVAGDQAGFGNTRDPGYDGVGVDNLIDTLLFLSIDDFDQIFDLDTGGADANIMYEGSFGGLSLTATVDSFEEDFGIVVDYDFGSFNVGILYMSGDEIGTEVGSGEGFGAETVGLTAGAMFAGFDLDFVYAETDIDGGGDLTGYGLSGAYGMGAYTFTFAANQVDVSEGDSGAAYGIGVDYDLGGGAKLQAGIGSIWDPVDDDNFTTASFGISMKF